MKVLIISSQELNELNLLSSTFELSQAKALLHKGIEVRILSAGFVTPKQIAAVLLQKLKGKKGWHYRFRHWSAFKTAAFLFMSPLYILFKRTFINSSMVDGIKIVEAFYLTTEANPVPVYYQLWNHHVLKGYDFISNNFVSDIIHAHSRFLLAGNTSLELKKRFGLPFVLTEHSSNYFRGALEPFEADMARSVIKGSVCNIAVSAPLARKINEVLKTNALFEIVPNILDETFECLNSSQKVSDCFVFLNVAYLLPVKNQKSLIDAFAILKKRLSNIQLNIAGDGELFGELQKRVVDLGVEDSVFFKGRLQKDEVRRLMQESQVIVLSSNFETFGVVLIEALSCGKPVIATKCGGPEEIVTEQNGLLVPVNDTEALAEAMLYIYQYYNDYNADFIRTDCVNKYGSEPIAKKLISIYDRSVSKNPTKTEGTFC